MDYELFHDESKEHGYWHGLLLVPVHGLERLLDDLERARNQTGFRDPIGIKNVKAASSPAFRCAEAWILLGVGWLRSKDKGEPYHVHYGSGKGANPSYEPLSADRQGAKLAIWRERDNHHNMGYLQGWAEKVETTLRIALKFALHSLGDGHECINVTKLHFDGCEHMGRPIDYERVVHRLKGLNANRLVTARPADITDYSSDHTRCEGDYGVCQLLQLTDLLVGGTRVQLEYTTKKPRDCKRDPHRTVSEPLRRPLNMFKRPERGRKNSRWYRSFAQTQGQIQGGVWDFSAIRPASKTENPPLF